MLLFLFLLFDPFIIRYLCLNLASNLIMESVNTPLADHLILIGGYYTMANDTYRAKTFNEAGLNIENQMEPIVSGKHAKTLVPRIGPSLITVIDQFIKTGTSDRLVELERQYAEQRQVIEYFCSFYGIGPATAITFYQEGYRTLDDLWHSGKLTDAQQVGILWRDHIKLRIPYSEMLILESAIGDILNPHNLRWDIAGSFRRQKSSSGDIDLLVQMDENITMQSVYDILKPIIPGTLAFGETKFMGIIRINESYNGHRLDIRFIHPTSYAYALMYFTGSQKFNILMRRQAITRGLTLNEYTLYDDQGNTLSADSEQEIFDYLGVAYLSPPDRTDEMDSLPLVN